MKVKQAKEIARAIRRLVEARFLMFKPEIERIEDFLMKRDEVMNEAEGDIVKALSENK